MNIVIRRFMVIYGEPKTPNPSEFRAEYERALSGYTESTLSRAVDHVVQEFKPFASQPWPAISAVIAACKKVCETTTDGKSEMDKIRAQIRETNRQAKARAAMWMERSPLGRQAILEGWPRELWNWVTQLYAKALTDGRRLDDEEIRFDPKRIEYARAHCSNQHWEKADLWVVFGTEEKALYWMKQRHGEDYEGPPQVAIQPRQNAKPHDWQRATATPFKAMQQASPNRELHREVSSITKRITGERE